MSNVTISPRSNKLKIHGARNRVSVGSAWTPTRTIRRAVAIWKASEYDDTQLLKDLTGNGLDARLGSTSGVDSADPKFLGYKPWGVNPDGSVNCGGTGNGVASSYQPSTSGDLDVRVRVRPTVAWSAAPSFSVLASRYNEVNGQKAWMVRTVFDKLRLQASLDGIAGAGVDAASTVSPGFAAGVLHWIRVHRSDATGLVTFYTSVTDTNDPDAVVWTQLGAAVATPSGQLFAAVADTRVGAYHTNMSAGFAGSYNVLQVRHGSSITHHFDASKIKTGPFYQDAQGNNWYGLGSAAWGDHYQHVGTMNGNGVSTPDSVNLSLGNKFDLRVLVSSPSSTTTFLSQQADPGGVGQRSFLFDLNGSLLRLVTYTDGTNININASSAMGIDQAPKWVRVVFDGDEGGSHSIRFYTSVDGLTWTSLGTTGGEIRAGTRAVFDGNLPLSIGSRSDLNGAPTANAKFYRAQVFASINGTDKRADVRFDKPLKWNNGQHTDPQGNVWTINRSALQNRLKVVANSHVEMFGTAGDRINTSDSTELSITGDIDIRWRGSLSSFTPATIQTLVSKWSTSTGYLLRVHTNGTLRLAIDSSTSIFSTLALSSHGVAAGVVKWVRATWRASDGRVQFFTSDDGITWAQLGADVMSGQLVLTDNATELEVGNRGTAELLAGRTYEVQVWKGIPGVSASARLVANPKFTALTSYAPYKEASYLAQPSVVGSYASTPDHNDLDVLGDLDLRAEASLDNWNTNLQYFLAKRTGTTTTAYYFNMGTSGKIALQWYDGATTFSRESTVAVAWEPGSKHWVRATLDVDNGAGGHDARFWTSDDGVTWTQLGATVTTAGITSIMNSTTPLLIGVANTTGTENLKGKIHRAIVKNGIDGTTVFDADFTNLLDGQASFVEVTGKTVTINGTARIERRTWSFTRAALSPRAELRTGRYAYLPGVLNNYFIFGGGSTPEVKIPGDIDLRACVSGITLTGSSQILIGRYRSTTATRSYALLITSAGTLQLQYSDGTTLYTISSTNPIPLDGGKLHVRATLDVDDGGGGHVRTLYTSLDGVTWTNVGGNTLAGVIELNHTNSDALVVGSNFLSTQFPVNGAIHSAELRDGINGTIVASFDLADAMLMPIEPHNGFTDHYSNVWTVNRAAGGLKTAIVAEPAFLFGTDDYMEVPHSTLLAVGPTDPLTVLTIIRVHAPGGTPIYIAKKTDTATASVGWYLRYTGSSTNLLVSDGAVQASVTGAAPTSGVRSYLSAKRDRVADEFRVRVNDVTGNGVPDNTTGTLDNGLPLRIGRGTGGGTNYADMEFMGAAIFKEALTDAQIAEVLKSFEYDPELVGVL